MWVVGIERFCGGFLSAFCILSFVFFVGLQAFPDVSDNITLQIFKSALLESILLAKVEESLY